MIRLLTLAALAAFATLVAPSYAASKKIDFLAVGLDNQIHGIQVDVLQNIPLQSWRPWSCQGAVDREKKTTSLICTNLEAGGRALLAGRIQDSVLCDGTPLLIWESGMKMPPERQEGMIAKAPCP